MRADQAAAMFVPVPPDAPRYLLQGLLDHPTHTSHCGDACLLNRYHTNAQFHAAVDQLVAALPWMVRGLAMGADVAQADTEQRIARMMRWGPPKDLIDRLTNPPEDTPDAPT